MRCLVPSLVDHAARDGIGQRRRAPGVGGAPETLNGMYFMGKFHGEWPLYMWIGVGAITLVALIAAVVIVRRW